MKRILLLFALMLASAVGVNAQVVLNIMSPSSIQGVLTHTNNGSTWGWGLADLNNPADAVLDTVVVMNDSTAGVNAVVGTDPTTGNAYPGIALKYEGCNLDTTSAWQTNRLAGKIVLIARGTCEFGKKVYLAEQAGARAVILYNRDNAQQTAGAGAYGALATIPFAMIARPDGDMLRLAIEGGQTVVAFLGNKIGAFPNDMSISPAEAMYPPALAVPALLAQDSSDFKMKLGFWTRNDGSANQSNVIGNVTVKRGGTTLYTQSTSSFAMNAGDSSYISFPPFQLNGYPLGAYEVNYNVNVANESFPLDNNIDFAAVINDSLFSYARVNPTTLLPEDNNSIRSPSFTSSWATGIHFRHPQASRMLLKGVRFACFTSSPDSLTGRSIDVAVDEWLDSFTDIVDTNCKVTNTSPLAVETYTYTVNAQNSMVTQLFDDPIELDDNMRYIISLNTSDQSIFMNHSYGPAYQLNDVTAGEQPRELIRVDNSWFTGGFSSGRIPTFQLIMEPKCVGALPTVGAGADVTVCAGTPVTLSGSGASTYTWNNGVSNGVAFTPTATTTYTVTGTNANGCVNTDQVTVTVNPLPVVNAGADVTVCAGTPVTLSGSGASTYTWNNGVSNTVAFTPTSTATYTVTGTDANGCVNTDQVTVTVNSLPVVNAGADVTVCAGTPVTLSGSGASTYTWNNGVSNGVAFTPTATTTYTVTGTATNGCVNTDQVLVTVVPHVVLPQIFGPGAVLPNTSYTYVTNQVIGNAYNWTLLGGAIVSGQGTNSVNVMWGNGGIGTVKVVESNGYCEKTDSISIQISGLSSNENSTPKAIATPNPNTGIFILEWQNLDASHVVIYNSVGQILATKKIQSGLAQAKLDLSSKAAGVYQVVIYGKEGQVTLPVQIRH